MQPVNHPFTSSLMLEHHPSCVVFGLDSKYRQVRHGWRSGFTEPDGGADGGLWFS